MRIQPNNAGVVGLGLGRNSENQGQGPTINLSKGEHVSLAKAAPKMDRVLVGLGWDVNEFVGAAYDLDVSVFLLGAGGKVPNNSYFVFYNQLESPEGSVVHTGDNLTGEGEGDDESVKVVLSKVPSNIDRILFTVTIHDAENRRQNFGNVENAFIRLVNEDTGAEVIRFNLTQEFSIETSVVVGELYRNGSEWSFKAVGQGLKADLFEFCARYGVSVG